MRPSKVVTKRSYVVTEQTLAEAFMLEPGELVTEMHHIEPVTLAGAGFWKIKTEQPANRNA